jgi:hypothetical protein
MNLNITPPEGILQELTAIDSFLTIECSEQIEEVVERGNTLAVYIARSGKLLADAKYHLNERLNSDVFKTLVEMSKQANSTAKATNAIVDSLCRNEKYLVDYADRINRAATHQIDWYRSILSKAKIEMQYLSSYNTMR